MSHRSRFRNKGSTKPPSDLNQTVSSNLKVKAGRPPTMIEDVLCPFGATAVPTQTTLGVPGIGFVRPPCTSKCAAFVPPETEEDGLGSCGAVSGVPFRIRARTASDEGAPKAEGGVPAGAPENTAPGEDSGAPSRGGLILP